MMAREFPPANYTITLGEVLSNGLVDFSLDIWDFQYYNTDQRDRIYNKITDRYYYAEIACVPVGKWRHFLLDALNKRAPKANLLYEFMDNTDNLQAGDKEHKLNRLVFSDFPQTALAANQDFATNSHDFEEQIDKALGSNELMDIWEKWRNPDDYLVDGIKSCFIPLLN